MKTSILSYKIIDDKKEKFNSIELIITLKNFLSQSFIKETSCSYIEADNVINFIYYFRTIKEAEEAYPKISQKIKNKEFLNEIKENNQNNQKD